MNASDTIEGRLRTALAAGGHRYTAQREAIFRCLAETDTHPTAEELHRSVRRQRPGISLATVYKTLEALVGCGVVQRLAFGEGPARYDGRTDRHYHARCDLCDRVFDVFDVGGDVDRQVLGSLDTSELPFRVGGVRLELSGRCRTCSPSV